MLLNLATLRTELGTRLRATSTISSSQKDLWLNLAQYDVATATDPQNLLINSQITSVVGQYKYFPSIPFLRITSVKNITHEQHLDPASTNDIDQWDPSRNETGTPSHFISNAGLEYVRAQPTSAGTISIVSSSANDLTQKVYIRGVVSGVERWERLTLNGTTSVPGTLSFDAATDVLPTIYMVAKSVATTGVITVTRGAVTLAVLAPDYLAEERQPLELWVTPSTASDVYTVRGYRSPRPMFNAEDFPDFPHFYHELVLIGAVIRGHRSLFRFNEANEIFRHEWAPKIQQFVGEQANHRANKPLVIQGSPSMIYNYDQMPWHEVYGD